MPRIIGGKYYVGEKLGSGLQGKVYMGINKDTDQKFALKVIDRSKLTPRQYENVQKELAALTRLRDHANIITAHEIMYDTELVKKDGSGVKKIILLVIEIADGGELFEYMMHTGPFSEALARHYFMCLISALEYCHSNGIYHRDLKPENLLLTSDFTLKVADFGLAAVTDGEDGAASLLRTTCGTRAYMAPEVLARMPYRGAPADVWSAAMILFIMVAGFPPMSAAQRGDWWFDRVTSNQYDLFWQAHERTGKFSPQFKDLINKMFVVDPARRATLADIKASAWFRGEGVPGVELTAVLTDLEGRKAKVKAHKASERAKAAERRAARKAALASGAVDVFERPVMRSLGKGDDEDPSGGDSLFVRAPTAPEHVLDLPNTFYADGTAAEVAMSVAEALGSQAKELGVEGEGVSTILKEGKVKVKSRALGVGITIYCAPEAGSGGEDDGLLQVVHVQASDSGDVLRTGDVAGLVESLEKSLMEGPEAGAK